MLDDFLETSQRSTGNEATDKAKIDKNSPHYIVGIGASAGGLDALERFFQNVPEDSGLSFVVVQHLSPHFKSLMNELLARHTSITIHRVEDAMTVEPNTIYLIPPRKNITFESEKLLLADQNHGDHLNLPIDIFLRSLAENAGERAIGVILSGTGSDGSRSLQDIHHAGGLIVVQEPESAGFDGMPWSAMATGLADIVTQPEEMAAQIIAYIQDGVIPGEIFKLGQELSEENQLSMIFALMRKTYQIDFSQYKSMTILRRLERRISLTNQMDMIAYFQLLKSDENELNLLYRDLLVEVTEFFRDREAFAALEEVVPQILENASAQEGIRIWVSGCATGEEAYSIGLLFRNYIDGYPPIFDTSPDKKLEFNREVLSGEAEETMTHSSTEVKIFATDLHQQSLAIAAKGAYSQERVAGLPLYLRDRYFTPNNNVYEVTQELRQMVIFAPHNLIQDPPFTKLDLVSCRNVLIYLRPDVQQKVLAHFHFGLKIGGYLLLGPSEHVGALEDELDTIDRRWRIYRKRRDIQLNKAMSKMSSSMFTAGQFKPILTHTPSLNGQESIYEMLLGEYMSPGFLVNTEYEVLHTFGNAGRYIRAMQGKTTLNVLNLLTGDLQLAVRAALHKATTDMVSVVYTGVHFSSPENDEHLKLTVKPFLDAQKHIHHYFIELERVTALGISTSSIAESEDISDFQFDSQAQDQITQLQIELKHTKEYLQTTIEELETTNEELQSTNEEMVAANEELQSTNEELHSVNEELYTVNSEYEQKIEELTQLTNDMKNLQESTQIGTIFLDEHLRIRDYTHTIADTVNLLPQDIGRPVEHLLYNLDVSREIVVGHIEQVFQNGTIFEQEISAIKGRNFLLRILPYRTESNITKGVVLTFVDISRLKKVQNERDSALLQLKESEALTVLNQQLQAEVAAHDQTEMALRQSQERYQAIVESQLDLICRYEINTLRLTFVNAAYCKAFEKSDQELIGQSFLKLIPKESHDDIRQHVKFLIENPEPYRYEHQAFAPDGSIIWQEWVDQAILDDTGRIIEIQAIGRDITSHKEAERALRENQELLQSIIDHADAGIVVRTTDGTNLLANKRISQMMGTSLEKVCAASNYQFISKEEAETTKMLDQQVIQEKKPVQQELTLTFPIGTRSILSSRFPILDPEGNVQSIGVITTDITDRKASEQKIQQLNTELSTTNMALEERVTERTEEIERRRIVAEGVRYVLAFLNSNHAIEQVLGYIVSQAQRLLEADTSIIYEYQPKKEQLILLAHDGLSAVDTQYAQKFAWPQYKDEQYMAVSDLTEAISDPILAARRKILHEAGYRSLLRLPIIIKEDFFGYLILYYQEAKSFSSEEIQIATTFSDHIALAIENSRLRTHVEAVATEAERSRIARDLHDSVNQTLFSANMIAEVLPKIWEMDPEEGKRGLAELRESTRGAVADMRALLLELRPKALTETSLADLLELLRKAAVGRVQIPMTLQTEGDYEPPADVKLVFYRTAQEALNNVAKHAEATQVFIHLLTSPEQVRITIQDDGYGFLPKEVGTGHMGLHIMHERAQSIGAQFEIESVLEQGTTISLVWGIK